MNLDVRGSSSTGSGGRVGEGSTGPHSAAANFYGYGEWRLDSGNLVSPWCGHTAQCANEEYFQLSTHLQSAAQSTH